MAVRTRALREAHAELAGILEHSADAIVGLDLGGRIRVWNRGAESLFGYTVTEARGRPLDDLLLSDDADSKCEAAFIQRELREHGAVVNFQTVRVPKGGGPFPVSLTHSLIRDDQDRPLGYSLIIRDTRSQAKLEEQMRRSQRLAAMSVMAAGLAHEVNNPLAIVENRIECMWHDVREKWPDTDLEKDIMALHEHVVRLREITADLLRFDRDDEDEPAPIVLNDLAVRVAGLLKQPLAARNIRVALTTAAELPPVPGSIKAIETVCVNLLLNAADVTPPGGTIVLETRQSAGDDAVELEVRDTGPGIPPELCDQIFEPFFTTKGAGSGTGLGLAVCRTIVERHCGKIWVDSNEGMGGSRFVVWLPLRPERAWRGREYS